MSSQSKQTAQISPTNKAVMRLSKDMGTKSIELGYKNTYSIADKLSKLYLAKLKV